MTTSRPYLHANLLTTAAGSVTLRAEAAQVDGVDYERRTISGLVVPFGVGGRTNLGHGLSVRAGAVRFREPHRRVIGVWGHTTPPGEQPRGFPEGSPVSRMVAYDTDAAGLRMRLRAARTPLGDQLLAEADPNEGGVRSSLSIELVDVAVDEWTAEIVDGLCEFVGHVPLGAYDDAQVTSVTASLHQHQGDNVPHRLTRSPFTREIITVGGGGQPAQPAPAQQAPAAQPQAPMSWVQVPQQQQQAPAQPQQLQAQQAPAAPQGQPFDWAALAAFAQVNGMLQGAPPAPPAVLTQPGLQAAPAPVPGLPGAPAAAPAGIPTGALPVAPSEGPRPSGHVRRMAQLQAAVFQSGGQPTAELRAALADITNTGLDLFQSPAAAIGQELWSGEGSYQRRYTTLMSQGELTSWKGTGWQWVTKPKVAAYAGDKAEIPTNTVSVEPKEWEARRAAAGWDVDRKFLDFGDAAFWEGFYRAQTDSYKELTDQWAIEAIVAAALDITLDANVPTEYQGVNVAQADIFKGVALGNAILEDTKNVKRTADYVMMNSSDWLQLLNYTNLDLPAFLRLLGVKPEDFMRTPDVPAGSLVLGVRPAMKFRELGNGSPIRVQALDVAHAGVDEAVYGYVAYSQERPGGVIRVPLVTA